MTTSSGSLVVTLVHTSTKNDGRRTRPLPALIAAAGYKAGMRFLEFFAARIRNPNTRRAYGRAVAEFLASCEDNHVPSIAAGTGRSATPPAPPRH